ncbi:MAG: hypothetical protein ABSF91_05670 [Bacteroidota bacterium]
MTNRFALVVLSLSLSVAAGRAQEKGSLVNFKHLERLTEKIEFLGDSVGIVHIYSNYPAYEWADANKEGVACVDDAARAAVVYLRHFELMNDERSLERAKSLLGFVMKMETDDGMFYNFILKDHSINASGRTSCASFGWWAARGVWCMSLGYRILKDRDRQFALLLKDHIEMSFPHIDSLLLKYNEVKVSKGYRVPRWLLYESGADATSELLLGLIEYYNATHSLKVKGLIEKLAEGLMVMQDGDMRTFPYALHRSWQTMWHMWGNGQTQALAAAGKILKSKKMIQSAEREAEGFYSRLLIEGLAKEMDVSSSGKTQRYEQIAYAVRPMAVGLIRLFEATHDTRYLKMAGLAASWFFGNNSLHQEMYDSTTGRCFDGLVDSMSVNKNCGAESAVEALYTLTELERYPLTIGYLHFQRTKRRTTSRYVYALFTNDSHAQVTVAIDMKKSMLLVLDGDDSVTFQEKVNHEE